MANDGSGAGLQPIFRGNRLIISARRCFGRAMAKYRYEHSQQDQIDDFWGSKFVNGGLKGDLELEPLRWIHYEHERWAGIG